MNLFVIITIRQPDVTQQLDLTAGMDAIRIVGWGAAAVRTAERGLSE